jgi:hypothetical protein
MVRKRINRRVLTPKPDAYRWLLRLRGDVDWLERLDVGTLPLLNRGDCHRLAEGTAGVLTRFAARVGAELKELNEVHKRVEKDLNA